VVFLFLWWALPTTIKSFVRINFSEFNAPTWLFTAKVDQVSAFWTQRNHSKIDLLEAGQEISRSNARYQIMAQRYQSFENEIERLEALLELPERSGFRHEIARVIQRDLSVWWQEIIIRKGRDYDISVGAAVIFAGGVVGRVKEVNAYTSRVELISSPNFRMAATFADDSRPVVYQGRIQSAIRQAIGEVRDAPQDLLTTSQEPLTLVSTHLGGTFPPGLTIGIVPWLEPGSTGIFQTGTVRLDPRLQDLHEVTVLIPIKLKKPATNAN
jgi:rod shape-determining protein MreC